MDPNTEETPLLMNNTANVSERSNTMNYTLRILRASMNTLVHSLIAVTVFVNLTFAFNSYPLNAFQLHVILSVIGYQLLMLHGILSLASNNGWSEPLTHIHRRRSHWILQLVGSILAISGSIIMMKQKTVNFNTIHGKLALTALILTCVSLLNGLTTLYKVAVRHLIPHQASKYSHLLIGTWAFILSSACLATGFLKRSFQKWSSKEFSYIMVAITIFFTFIIAVRPFYTILQKIYRIFKNRRR